MWIDTEGTIIIGNQLVIESIPDNNTLGVVFEDDTLTGFFYAIENINDEVKIIDAVQIYNVDEYDANTPVELKLVWSEDNKISGLYINNECVAIFDFINNGGYCKSEYPPIQNPWTKKGRKLTPEAEILLQKN